MEKQKSIGAWKNQTTKGTVVNFTINGQKYSMWENTFKKNPKDPDYRIVENNYKAEDKKEPSDSLPF